MGIKTEASEPHLSQSIVALLWAVWKYMIKYFPGDLML